MLIGITGTDGSGKGTVVKYLVKNYGFVHYSARDLIVEELKSQGIEASRQNMRLVANQMRKNEGYDVIVKKSLAKMAASEAKCVVIESIRTLKEVETLKENEGILLAIDADQKIRYERVVSRKSESDKVTFEEFVSQEELEMDDPDPNGMQKSAVIEAADYTIFNDNHIDKLYEDIEVFLKKFMG